MSPERDACHYLTEFRGHTIRCHRTGTCFPPTVHVCTDRLRSIGSECKGHAFPDFTATMRSSDSLFPIDRRSSLPLRTIYHEHSWRWRVSQVTGPSSCARAAIPNSVRCADLWPNPARPALLPSSYRAHSAPERQQISKPTHAAHALAHLRIAEPVTESSARLTTDLLGFALVGWDSHPQDDLRDFQKRFTHSFPSRPVFPGHSR